MEVCTGVHARNNRGHPLPVVPHCHAVIKPPRATAAAHARRAEW
jgi:hypothetical protein